MANGERHTLYYREVENNNGYFFCAVQLPLLSEEFEVPAFELNPILPGGSKAMLDIGFTYDWYVIYREGPWRLLCVALNPRFVKQAKGFVWTVQESQENPFGSLVKVKVKFIGGSEKAPQIWQAARRPGKVVSLFGEVDHEGPFHLSVSYQS